MRIIMILLRNYQCEGLALVAVEVGTGGEFAGDGDVACAVALGIGIY